MMLPILGGVWWESQDGRVCIVRHCDVAFELFCDGIPVMPVSSFDVVSAYLWAEFPPEGFGA